MTVDLHLHTHYSDGSWAPSALVQHAIKMKLKYIAVTDHDTVCGVDEAVDSAGDRLKIIPAVEINTIRALPDGGHEDIHVLGYFIDTKSEELLAVLNEQQEARQAHLLECIENINRAGVAISESMVRQRAGRGSIGRAHITMAVVDAGGASDLTEAYQKYMVKSSPCFARRRSVSPAAAIKAIKAAGGVASIAHPGKAPHMRDVILELKEHGLDGIEAFHRIHSVDVVRHYIRFAHKHSMLVTGGSDCHGPYQDYAPTVGSISLPDEVLRNLLKAVG